MNILYYNDLNFLKVKKQFEKTVDYLKNGDFAAADVKKMVNTGFYRAKIDYDTRLLFKFSDYGNQTYILLLEVIYNHEYNKSRFLHGAIIDENKLLSLTNPDKVSREDISKLVYLNSRTGNFYLLDKVLSFDEAQEEILETNPPVIVIGSAGSGKTVLTLEKIKKLEGSILYITLSPYLVENSTNLYYANRYENEKQEIDFLSFKEFLETFRIIPGREVDFRTFDAWIHTRLQSFGIKNTYKLFEEFRGVITGSDISKEYLTRDEYLSLGVKQSIFLNSERNNVYNAFEKYLAFMKENNLYDLNLISYRWIEHCRKKYDFIVIDEVQDFTNIQLYIILQSLKTRENFILCGDSNQIVHPNFFSWSHIKTMFYQHEITTNDIRILRTNFRNSIRITSIANRLLKIKNARFGSIDKESTYLVEPVSTNQGDVVFLKDNTDIRKQLQDKTGRSANYAVLVMHAEDKMEVRRYFKTPLLFSIHEAKGLEYENIIMVNFISGNDREFREIAGEITMQELEEDQLHFSRARDKTDKSLDAYKFYINSFYVGITRAVKNLYILEASDKHEILYLIGLVNATGSIGIKEQISSAEEWKNEARRLEKQGKKEQAEEIHKTILSVQKTEWEPITPDNIEELKKQALNPDFFNKKDKDKLFAYALLYNDEDSLDKLSFLKYRKADDPDTERNSIYRKFYHEYLSDNVGAVKQKVKKYGINYRDLFNVTPMLAAIQAGSMKILDFLTRSGADASLTDNLGRNALQIALNQSFLLKGYAVKKLAILYPYLLTDYLKIKMDDKLVKIDNRKIDYFLINFFIALQDTVNTRKRYWEPKGITAVELEQAVTDYPDVVLPEYRKKRTYLSANLSKNEMGSTNPYNKKLFYRMERGCYVLNPDMEILVREEWKNVYDLMRIEKIKIASPSGKSANNNINFLKTIKKIEKKSPELKKIMKEALSYDTKVTEKNDSEKKEQKNTPIQKPENQKDPKQYKLPF